VICLVFILPDIEIEDLYVLNSLFTNIEQSGETEPSGENTGKLLNFIFNSPFTLNFLYVVQSPSIFFCRKISLLF
jgi:hypothetical protein